VLGRRFGGLYLEPEMDTPRKKAIPEEAAPTSFPLWPFAYMAYAERIGRDYRQHLTKLGQAATGVEMVQSESLYDAHALSDLTKAFYNLALAPYSALWTAAAGAAPSLPFEEFAAAAAPSLPFEELDGPETPASASALPFSQPGID
jgi:hypothetical protein